MRAEAYDYCPHQQSQPLRVAVCREIGCSTLAVCMALPSTEQVCSCINNSQAGRHTARSVCSVYLLDQGASIHCAGVVLVRVIVHSPLRHMIGLSHLGGLHCHRCIQQLYSSCSGIAVNMLMVGRVYIVDCRTWHGILCSLTTLLQCAKGRVQIFISITMRQLQSPSPSSLVMSKKSSRCILQTLFSMKT